MRTLVLTAGEAGSQDAAAIAAGHPSRELMQNAGNAAAALLLDRFPLEAARGVAIYAGSGNNGGDAWVVAAALARRGVRVRVQEVVPAKTSDARAEREVASSLLEHAIPDGTEGVIVDGLLGTGTQGAPRAEIAAAIEGIAHAVAHSKGAKRVVALDIPSGVDATTGVTAGAYVRADLTVTFGSIKRALLVNREAAGEIVVVDIGVGACGVGGHAEANTIPRLVDADFVRDFVPAIGASAHKGARKRVVIVGGERGMAGAAILAARGALRSGAGMVRLCVADASIAPAQSAEPSAMATAWPISDAELEALTDWAHVLLIGPGLGTDADSRALVERLLRSWKGAVVLDAGALTMFGHDLAALRDLLVVPGGRRAVITPHAVELSRLASVSPGEVHSRRFELAGEIAIQLGVTVLLKGVPTVVSDGNSTLVSATGTPVLATGGAGDILGGMVATLLAQTALPCESAAAAAWVHGRAAEIAGRSQVRGIILDDVLVALRDAWRIESPELVAPVIAHLPAIA